MAAFRFVHAADVHLDSPLRSLALRNGDLAELIGTATRRAFSRIVDLCRAEKVDALILAGDLYDGDQTSMKTAKFLAGEVRRLHEAGIRTYIIRGNHDAMSVITGTNELVFPETVKVYNEKAEAVVFSREDGPSVAIHGLSFAKPHAPESLLVGYQPRSADMINVGILHTSLAGGAGHDPYSPCRMSDLKATEFDYWALGHIHRRSADRGACTVVMAGMPQGRDINEDGAKGVTLVSIGDDRSVTLEERLTSVAQFERLELDVSAVRDWSELPDLVERALGAERNRAASEQLIVRLRLVGATPLSWRLRRDEDLLVGEIEQRASAIGSTWVEKVELATTNGAPGGRTADPLVALRGLVDDEILNSEAFAKDLSKVVDEMRRQLPPECRAALGFDEAASGAVLTGLAHEGADDVFAQMQAKGSAT